MKEKRFKSKRKAETWAIGNCRGRALHTVIRHGVECSYWSRGRCDCSPDYVISEVIKGEKPPRGVWRHEKKETRK